MSLLAESRVVVTDYGRRSCYRRDDLVVSGLSVEAIPILFLVFVRTDANKNCVTAASDKESAQCLALGASSARTDTTSQKMLDALADRKG